MKPRQIQAEVFHQNTCILAEGPFWFDQQLWWIDIEAGRLHASHANGHLINRWSFHQRIGAAVPIDSKKFVVALERQIACFHLDSQKMEVWAQPNIPADSRFNDGKCDPLGRFLIGTLCMKGGKGTSSLFSFQKNKPLKLLRSGISISNGLVWSHDGKTLYYIDTLQRCVFAYDYDLQSGSILHERIALHFTEKEGWPDGMTTDQNGYLWIAFWEGSKVRCYLPFKNECLAEIQLPCTHPTSCCFGGENLDQLFITTARAKLEPERLSSQPLAGSIFVCKPGTSGFPTSLFLHG